MRKKKFGVFVSLLVVAILAMPMSNVFAIPPTPVTAIHFYVTDYPAEQIDRELGESGNIYRTIVDLPVAFSGPILGVGDYDAHVLVKPDGTINAHGVVTLTFAMVDGKTGTLIIKMETYNWRIISGTGNLENLHGKGTVTWVNPIHYILDGQIHFDS
jgi:hypothetical protein